MIRRYIESCLLIELLQHQHPLIEVSVTIHTQVLFVLIMKALKYLLVVDELNKEEDSYLCNVVWNVTRHYYYLLF